MNLYRALRPVLFALPPETAHGVVSRALSGIQDTPLERVLARRYTVDDPRLETGAFGLTFPNPVGMAGGFDKNAAFPTVVGALGFGFLEIGAVTAKAQPGNPRPRLYRLPADQALINRLGFNNEGADRIADRLAATPDTGVPLGVNMGKSKVTPNDRAPEDYVYTYERLAPHGDFFVVNVSSPNTPGLRELQSRDRLEGILSALIDEGASPLLVKLSPDLAEEAVADAVELAEDLGLDGIVATNASDRRPDTLRGRHRHEDGGLSGKPIEDRSTEVVRFVASRTELPVIGVGGVFTAQDAYRKIRAGASLVQLYTGLIFRGPAIAREINEGLASLLEGDGFDSVDEAVGADLR